MIELDVPARKLHLDVSDAELAKRRAAWMAPEPPKRGYYKLYVETRAAGGQGRGPGFPGRRQRHDRHARFALSVDSSGTNQRLPRGR